MVRSFTAVEQDLGLQRYLHSDLGTLYFVPDPQGACDVIVRHFDQDVSRSFIGSFVAIIEEAQSWIERHPTLNRLVVVEQPIEVGTDFVMRPFHVYGTSTDAYVEWDDPPEPPEELEQMRSAFQAAVGKTDSGRDRIIESVLARSLVEPNSKTYFAEPDGSDNAGQFVVVEPRIVKEDLIAWNAA